MELSEDHINEKDAKSFFIVIEIHYYYTNMNLLAFHVDITYLNESMNSLKHNQND